MDGHWCHTMMTLKHTFIVGLLKLLEDTFNLQIGLYNQNVNLTHGTWNGEPNMHKRCNGQVRDKHEQTFVLTIKRVYVYLHTHIHLWLAPLLTTTGYSFFVNST